MHRNNIAILPLKLLALATSLVLCPIAPTCGQLVPGSDDASKEPDPRLELEAEAKLPGVDPERRRDAVRTDQTLLNDAPRNSTTQGQPGQPDPFKEASQRAPATSQLGGGLSLETPNAVGLQAELAATRAELAETKELVRGMMREDIKKLTESRELPPLKEGEIRSFALKNIQANDAVETINRLFGTEGIRVAVDNRSNSLITFGTPDLVTSVDTLLTELEHRAGPSAAPVSMVDASSQTTRTLMLRVFWLANGADDLDSADGYLPPGVIKSLGKLGLADPRLVTQTVNSLSAEDGGGIVDFSSNVPAMLFQQPVTLTSSGMLSVTTDGRAEVEMQLSVGGPGVSCELKGSLTTPLGHYMVLGTANSVIPEYDTSGGGGAAPREGAGMGMPMGRGGEMGRGGGGYGGRGGEMGRGMAMGALPGAKYNASRFAFVVQVIEAESFEAAVESQ